MDSNSDRAKSASAVSTLSAWAAAAVKSQLPPDVYRRAALVLADDLGAMIAASSDLRVRRAQEQFHGSGDVEATVFASGAPRLDRYSAAAANALAVTWCELDEGYRKESCHAGAYILPAILAEGESRGSDVGTVLRAIAIGYEMTARLASAFPFQEAGRVHPHAAFSSIGAAVGAALMRGMDKNSLIACVNTAASLAFATPFRHAMDGALVRNALNSAGTWVGLRSIDWAEAGITGIPETPYDIYVGSMRAVAKPAELIEALGGSWAILDNFHKIHACCQLLHSAVEASLDIRSRLGGRRVQDIERIRVQTHPRGLQMTAVDPPTSLAAQFSMPHAIAAVAVLGVADQTAFCENACFHNQDIARLRRRVNVIAIGELGAAPNDRPAHVTWVFRDGSEISAKCLSARGGPDRPFDEATLMRKMSGCVSGEFPRMSDQLTRIVDSPQKVLRDGWTETVRLMTAKS